MEVLFENVYTDTEKMFREITAKIGMRKLWFWLMLYIPLDLYFLWSILIERTWITATMLLISLGYTFWIVLRPIYVGKSTIRKLRKYYNGTIPETIVQFGDKITVRGPDSMFSMTYEKLTKVYFLKHSVVLRAGKVSTIIIATTGFTKGSLPEFYEFLCETCPQLRLLRGSGRTLISSERKTTHESNLPN